MSASSHYNLLGVAPDADEAAITAAYEQQRARYAPERVAELDAELRAVAAARAAELERAYALLRDPARRRQYDASLGVAGAPPRVAARRSLTRREQLTAFAIAFAAVGLVAAIWLLTAREPGVASQAMGEVNRPAPAFAAPALTGGTVDLASYRGRVVLINFWGTWCEPCKRELPALQAAYEQLAGEGLMVIGVNLTDDELVQGQTTGDIARFLEEYGVSYPTALDMEGDITAAYRVFPLPTSFFVDGEGRIRYVHVGELTFDDVAARFAELRPAAGGLR